MLVIHRRVNDELILTVPPGFSGEIRVMLVDVGHRRPDSKRALRKGRAWIGVQAPQGVLVRRAELGPEVRP